jgi:AraC family transcriptional regulator, regulatory protein of adaptative response / DNA-3-methyladenine glycosylase II
VIFSHLNTIVGIERDVASQRSRIVTLRAANRRSRLVGSAIRIQLPYVPPFDWTALLGWFRTHHAGGVEAVSEDAYERAVRVGDAFGFLRVTNDPRHDRLLLDVTAGNGAIIGPIADRVRHMFDLDRNPGEVADGFRGVPMLDGLRLQYPGLRIARNWSPFEAAVLAIVGQLVSRTRACELLRNLAEAFGESATHPVDGRAFRLFPTPERLAEADLTGIGTTRARQAAIRAFAGLVRDGMLDPEPGPHAESWSRDRLLDIPGIGPWSAEVIRLRGVGDPDAFPASDLILRRALDRHRDIDFDAARPWRSYAAIHLWRHYGTTLSQHRGKLP